jgi:hypothetical protein
MYISVCSVGGAAKAVCVCELHRHRVTHRYTCRYLGVSGIYFDGARRRCRAAHGSARQAAGCAWACMGTARKVLGISRGTLQHSTGRVLTASSVLAERQCRDAHSSRALRLLSGRTTALALYTFLRVCSADTGADQPRRLQPANGAAEDVCTDVVADASRRCAPCCFDADEPADGAGPVPCH